jgi:hypothetical protein
MGRNIGSQSHQRSYKRIKTNNKKEGSTPSHTFADVQSRNRLEHQIVLVCRDEKRREIRAVQMHKCEPCGSVRKGSKQSNNENQNNKELGRRAS